MELKHVAHTPRTWFDQPRQHGNCEDSPNKTEYEDLPVERCGSRPFGGDVIVNAAANHSGDALGEIAGRVVNRHKRRVELAGKSSMRGNVAAIFTPTKVTVQRQSYELYVCFPRTQLPPHSR